jgi:acyl transferase domain-containing protein
MTELAPSPLRSVESLPDPESKRDVVHAPPAAYLLPISAASQPDLRRVAGGYLDVLAAPGRPADLLAACVRAGASQPHHRYRHAVVGRDRQQLVNRLREFSAGTAGPGAGGDRAPRVIFVFPGQGAQRAGMARELLATLPRFAGHLRTCDRAIRAEAGWSVLDFLHDEAPTAAEGHVQPALWALQVSLAKVWREWGIEPHTVVGHSMGEIAAAVIAGALTVAEGAAVVCRRSALIDTIDGCGDMWAVQLGEREAQQAIGGRSDRMAVAAVNSPHFTTISGEAQACQDVVTPLLERRVFCRRVKIGLASHSPRVEPILSGLRAQLAGIAPRDGQIPMYSTVRDRVLVGRELSAGYWAANLRQPVLFSAACRAVTADQAPTLFIEVGPQATLTAAIEDNIDSNGCDAVVLPSIRRDWHETESLLVSLGTAYEHGCDPVWDRLY